MKALTLKHWVSERNVITCGWHSSACAAQLSIRYWCHGLVHFLWCRLHRKCFFFWVILHLILHVATSIPQLWFQMIFCYWCNLIINGLFKPILSDEWISIKIVYGKDGMRRTVVMCPRKQDYHTMENCMYYPLLWIIKQWSECFPLNYWFTIMRNIPCAFILIFSIP